MTSDFTDLDEVEVLEVHPKVAFACGLSSHDSLVVRKRILQCLYIPEQERLVIYINTTTSMSPMSPCTTEATASVMTPLVTIKYHTTASSPRPHILYVVNATLDAVQSVVYRRYSDFVALHGEEITFVDRDTPALDAEIDAIESLKDPYALPPKRLLSTTFIPSAWADDSLINERKLGLSRYLQDLIKSPDYKDNSTLLQFFTDSNRHTLPRFHLEDVLPLTLSKKATFKDPNLQESEDRKASATLIAASYYPYWSSYPPENLDFSKFDILFFAFATPSSSYGLALDSGSQAVLKRLATAAHSSGYGTKVVLSVGGWGGCEYYSAAVSTSANRATFVNAIQSAVSSNGLDGVDLDWEYPNSPGAGQPYSSADAANFLTFITSLRTALGSSKIISTAVSHLPWLGANGSPLTNVSAYAIQLTYINIMNYDVWGASSTPGPNAPLGNLCGTSTQPQASAQAAFSQWTAAGCPASKLLLGLPLYGYVSKSSKTSLTGSFLPSPDMLLLQQKNEATHGERKDGMHFLNGAHPRLKKVGNAAAFADLTGWWGQQIPFNSIVSSGALVKQSDGNYGQGGGFTMAWDDCSDTPFLFNTSQTTVVTYDDTWSLADKATFAKNSGMAGCFTWSFDQDDGMTLQNVIRTNLGK